jgi:RNA polymerase sigma factor (sigma-70 family)
MAISFSSCGSIVTLLLQRGSDRDVRDATDTDALSCQAADVAVGATFWGQTRGPVLSGGAGVRIMVMASTLSDRELVSRCRAGDQQAWNELVERFSRYVYAISVQAFRLSESDAEDVFQEVFARAYQHLDKLRDDSALRPWLAQLTRRLCIDRLRATARERPVAEEELSDVGSEETLALLDEALTVHEALAAAPEHCQEILDRFFARDESYKTIGEALELPSGTIASRISRCLARLREHMEGRNEGETPSGDR